uniref:EBNA-2 n=1 Tax=Epstein-Barr virus (strain GD1) TaxID=10376 RepID=A0A3R6A9X6_EBVG|nr:EBNA-2 [human gammaherpesvirus 4]QAQ69436.1 EBNA-2 [human gammaherpesvirus 4]
MPTYYLALHGGQSYNLIVDTDMSGNPSLSVIPTNPYQEQLSNNPLIQLQIVVGENTGAPAPPQPPPPPPPPPPPERRDAWTQEPLPLDMNPLGSDTGHGPLASSIRMLCMAQYLLRNARGQQGLLRPLGPQTRSQVTLERQPVHAPRQEAPIILLQSPEPPRFTPVPMVALGHTLQPTPPPRPTLSQPRIPLIMPPRHTNQPATTPPTAPQRLTLGHQLSLPLHPPPHQSTPHCSSDSTGLPPPPTSYSIPSMTLSPEPLPPPAAPAHPLPGVIYDQQALPPTPGPPWWPPVRDPMPTTQTPPTNTKQGPDQGKGRGRWRGRGRSKGRGRMHKLPEPRRPGPDTSSPSMPQLSPVVSLHQGQGPENSPTPGPSTAGPVCRVTPSATPDISPIHEPESSDSEEPPFLFPSDWYPPTLEPAELDESWEGIFETTESHSSDEENVGGPSKRPRTSTQ